MMWTERPDAEVAKAKLCEMGYCEPGALTKWKRPPRVEPLDPDAEARRRCNGVLADVVGKGKTCLNPGDPDAREFRDCKDGACGPVMVALPKGALYARNFGCRSCEDGRRGSWREAPARDRAPRPRG